MLIFSGSPSCFLHMDTSFKHKCELQSESPLSFQEGAVKKIDYTSVKKQKKTIQQQKK